MKKTVDNDLLIVLPRKKIAFLKTNYNIAQMKTNSDYR
jgi:hypothetical protein